MGLVHVELTARIHGRRSGRGGATVPAALVEENALHDLPRRERARQRCCAPARGGGGSRAAPRASGPRAAPSRVTCVIVPCRCSREILDESRTILLRCVSSPLGLPFSPPEDNRYLLGVCTSARRPQSISPSSSATVAAAARALPAAPKVCEPAFGLLDLVGQVFDLRRDVPDTCQATKCTSRRLSRRKVRAARTRRWRASARRRAWRSSTCSRSCSAARCRRPT